MDTVRLATAACASYAGNAALGLAVATRMVDTSRAKWLHHGLYISTFALTGLAALTAVGPFAHARSKRSRAKITVGLPGGLPGWLLLPALVPLAVISKVDARSTAHPIVALTAAPFYLAAGIAAGVEVARGRRQRGWRR